MCIKGDGGKINKQTYFFLFKTSLYGIIVVYAKMLNESDQKDKKIETIIRKPKYLSFN